MATTHVSLTAGPNGASPLSGLEFVIENGPATGTYTSFMSGTSMLGIEVAAGVLYALRPSGASGHIQAYTTFAPGDTWLLTNRTAERGDAQELDVQLFTTANGELDRRTLQPGASVSFVISEPRDLTRFTLEAANAACVAGCTRVLLADGSRQSVSKLKAGARLATVTRRAARVLEVIRFDEASRDYYRVQRSGLLVRAGHPVLRPDGRESTPELLCEEGGASRVQLAEPLHPYTLITDQQTFVSMDNEWVSTWSAASWALSDASRLPHSRAPIA